MKYRKLGKGGPQCPRIVLGCMRIGDKPVERTEALISAALDAGVNMFDHADIYAGGESERKFGEAVRNPNAAFGRACTIFRGNISSGLRKTA